MLAEKLFAVRTGAPLKIDLVVYLPTHNALVAAELLGHLFNDAAAVLYIMRIVRATVSATAVSCLYATALKHSNVGVHLREPNGRSRGGSAEKNVDACRGKLIYNLVYPGKIIVSGCGLKS